MILFRRTLELFGINPERFQVSWISAAEGLKFAQTATALVEKAKELGPNLAIIRDYSEPFLSDGLSVEVSE